MERSAVVDRMLSTMDNIHELGRQRAFELDNPFYFKKAGDGEYYHKELPSGEQYLVQVEIIIDDIDFPISVQDTLIQQIIP